MSSISLTTPQESPESLSRDRLQEALDLVTDEAAEILRHGRTHRDYTRTERLLAIAHAIRRELATSVEELLEPREMTLGTGNTNIIWRGAMETEDAEYPRAKAQTAKADMRREQELAQIEALEAKRRRDNAEAREALARELKILSDIDASKFDETPRAQIGRRIAEILYDLAPQESEGDNERQVP